MADSIKKFIEVFVPNTACNLKCSYCYLAQTGTLTNQKPDFKFSNDVMLKSIKKERLGGICLFNIVADGETMLEQRTMDFIHGLVEEGHYVNIVTNATLTKRFDEMISWGEDLCKRITLIASFHYLELKEKNLLNIFFSNIKKASKAGCSYFLSIVLCQEYIDCMDEIKRVCMDNLGILPQPARVRDENSDDLHILVDMDEDEYYDLGIKEFSSPFFQFEKDFYKKYIDSFCYAGKWFAYLNLCTGDLQACYSQPIFDNLFINPDKPIKFKAIGNHCKCPYCYNGISRIPLGVVPDIKDVKTYWEYRNRTDVNGKDTFTDQVKGISDKRLYETNREYSKLRKGLANLSYEKNYGNYKYGYLSMIKMKLSSMLK